MSSPARLGGGIGREPGLILPRLILERMIAHARQESPVECCGLLGGRGPLVDSIYPLRNKDGSQTRYSAEEHDLIRAVRSIRDRSAEVVAIYHSHPRWPAIPSQTDLRENYWGLVPRPIISLLEDPPSVRVWVLESDRYHEMNWCVLETPEASVVEEGQDGSLYCPEVARGRGLPSDLPDS